MAALTSVSLEKCRKVNGELLFKIETAVYPNWEGTEQVRDFTFKDGTLTYSVPANASGNGTVAYSIWQRVPQ